MATLVQGVDDLFGDTLGLGVIALIQQTTGIGVGVGDPDLVAAGHVIQRGAGRGIAPDGGHCGGGAAKRGAVTVDIGTAGIDIADGGGLRIRAEQVDVHNAVVALGP